MSPFAAGMAPPAAAPSGASSVTYAASPTRFLTLALFSCVAFLIAGTWMALAPISDLAAARYGVSLNAVDQLALIFMYVYVPGTAVTLWLVDTAGVRACLLTASAVNAAAIAARWAALTLPGVSPHAAYAITVLSQARAHMRRRGPHNSADAAPHATHLRSWWRRWCSRCR